MNTGSVRMLRFLAFATATSNFFTLPALCSQRCSLPFTSQVMLSVFYVVLKCVDLSVVCQLMAGGKKKAGRALTEQKTECCFKLE